MDTNGLIDLRLGSWTLKVRPPLEGGSPHPVIFLIHGWTGDERSMWVFASRLPRSALLVAPRAPFVSNHAELDGYSWVEKRAGEFSQVSAFAPALDSFDDLWEALANQFPEANFDNVSLMGFSQGAAFSFALAMRHPQRVARLAALASFLPAGSEDQLPAIASVPIFVAHGTRDETVPVAMAREARQALESAGARVQYCESDTGHKLGANCATQLGEFMRP